MISTGQLLVYKDKNQFLSKCIKLKDPCKKKEVHIRYKQCRNILSTLLKKVNNFILPDFFKKTLKNLKICGVE